MDTSLKLTTLDMKTRLSALWIFVLLNMLFRDIHELFRPGFVEEIMTGTISGNAMTEEFLLVAGIILEILILMVLLSRILPYRINRWTNIIAAVAAIGLIAANGTNDLDDIFFASVEMLALVFIIWSAWRWRSPEA